MSQDTEYNSSNKRSFVLENRVDSSVLDEEEEVFCFSFRVVSEDGALH
jgi:hypothetical protein